MQNPEIKQFPFVSQRNVNPNQPKTQMNIAEFCINYTNLDSKFIGYG